MRSRMLLWGRWLALSGCLTPTVWGAIAQAESNDPPFDRSAQRVISVPQSTQVAKPATKQPPLAQPATVRGEWATASDTPAKVKASAQSFSETPNIWKDTAGWAQTSDLPQASQLFKTKPAIMPEGGFIQSDFSGAFRMAGFKQPGVGSQPEAPGAQPDAFTAPDLNLLDLSRFREDISAGVLFRPTDTGSKAPDTGEFLSQANGGNTVEVQRRSAVSFDPNIRGFRGGQLYTQADGAYWIAARPDLDSMLSKIDSNTIQDVVVISGPYGLRYGPGFSFIDIQTIPTPRYNSPESHLQLSTNYRANGAQIYGRETVFGGGQNYGYRISSGQRRGNDYWSGSPGLERIPGSYRYTDINADFGYSLSDTQRIEFSAMRLDQGDTEIPLQLFDLNYLKTDAYNVRIVDEGNEGPWTRLAVEGWYNHTSIGGDTNDKRNPDYPVIQRIENAVDVFGGDPLGTTRLFAETSGMQYSSGTRVVARFGDVQDVHLNTGADFRYVTQRIDELFSVTGSSLIPAPLPANFSSNLPKSFFADTGVFSEMAVPWTSYMKTTIGARVDWAHTNTRDPDAPGILNPFRDQFEQNDVLYAFYLSNELQVDDNITLLAAAGHAQRAPTLIERYSQNVFLGLFQSGFTRVIGDPGLRPERNWQVDMSVRADYENVRARLTGYHSWVINYITVSGSTVVAPPLNDARTLQFINATAPAQLFGFESVGEVDLTAMATGFTTMRFNRGWNSETAAALPGIFPLESQIGLRLHDAAGGRDWGFDTILRMVTTQDRLGVIRGVGGANEVLEQRTPGFSTVNLRGYYNLASNLRINGGIDNVLNKLYYSHLDLRLTSSVPAAANRPVYVYSPGITPFLGLDYTY